MVGARRAPGQRRCRGCVSSRGRREAASERPSGPLAMRPGERSERDDEVGPSRLAGARPSALREVSGQDTSREIVGLQVFRRPGTDRRGEGVVGLWWGFGGPAVGPGAAHPRSSGRARRRKGPGVMNRQRTSSARAADGSSSLPTAKPASARSSASSWSRHARHRAYSRSWFRQKPCGPTAGSPQSGRRQKGVGSGARTWPSWSGGSAVLPPTVRWRSWRARRAPREFVVSRPHRAPRLWVAQVARLKCGLKEASSTQGPGPITLEDVAPCPTALAVGLVYWSLQDALHKRQPQARGFRVVLGRQGRRRGPWRRAARASLDPDDVLLSRGRRVNGARLRRASRSVCPERARAPSSRRRGR